MMPTSESSGLEVLIFFLEQRWNEDVETFANPIVRDRAARSYECLTLLESVLWMVVGNRLGQFPDNSVKAILQDEHELIRSAAEYAKGNGVISRFPPEFDTVFSTIENSDAIEWTYHVETPTKDVRLFFRTCMYMNLNLTRHRRAREVGQLLSVSNAVEWESVRTQLKEARRMFSLKDLDNPKIQGSAVLASTIFAGQLKIIEFMERQRDLMAPALSDDATEAVKQAAKLLQGLQQWRLYFRDFEVKKRFDEVSQFMVDQIVKDDDSYFREHRQELVTYVTARLKPLFEMWGDEPMALVAGAGLK